MPRPRGWQNRCVAQHRDSEPTAATERDVELRNPFRSEADAFRLLLIVGAAIAAIAVAAVVGGAWLGVPVAVVLVALGARASYRWLRVAIAEREL